MRWLWAVPSSGGSAMLEISRSSPTESRNLSALLPRPPARAFRDTRTRQGELLLPYAAVAPGGVPLVEQGLQRHRAEEDAPLWVSACLVGFQAGGLVIEPAGEQHHVRVVRVEDVARL